MNDLPAQAGYTAYETDPLFGAFPGGYDAQQHYGSDQHPQHQHQHQQEQHHAQQDAYGNEPYQVQQYGYAYAEPTGQWNGHFSAPDPYSPAAAHLQAQAQAPMQAPAPADPQYGYEPAHEHGYASEAITPTPTLAHGFPVTEAYGHYQEQAAPAAPGYQPTMQWTVPAEVVGDHLDLQHQQGGGEPLSPVQAAAPGPAPSPYDAGWYASQDTVIAHLAGPVAAPDGHTVAGPGQGPGPEPEQARDHGTPSGPDGPHGPQHAEAEQDGAGPLSDPGSEELLVEPAEEAEEPLVESVESAESAPELRAGRAGSRTAARAGSSRNRRRAPAKRSALFTIAVPSACVMGVAGIAAASVSAVGGEDTQDGTATTAAADPASVKPVAANNKMDTQLAALSADARDFGDRASRTQERIDLKERQAAEKKKREEEAARKEAARPKYLLPVKRRGLSAYFGQAGVNWMSVHTGIDFPVMTGTPVMAATDGTVRTQWNSSYGNMAIVTAADGTETWYCHLSSTRVRSGSVKAGDLIAYSGNTGNTTGPHLHFEVRPGGGAAIDPLPWLRSHDLDPT